MTGLRRSRRKRSLSPEGSPEFPDIATVIRTTKKKRQSVVDAEDSQQAQEIASKEAPQRYQTRNPDRRPGVEAGLAPRTREQIEAAAQIKKAQLAAELANEEAERAAKEVERAKKVDQFARVMDEQARQRGLDALAFDRNPIVGEPTESQEEDEDETYPVNPKDPRNEENARPDKPRGKGRTASNSRKVSQTPLARDDSDIEVLEPEVPSKKKALTQKQKRALRQETVLDDLQSRRETPALSMSASGALSHPTTPASSKRSNPNEETPLAAFNPHWRRQLLAHTKSPAPRKKGASNRVGSGPSVTTPSSPSPLTFRKTVTPRPVEDKDHHFDNEKGLEAKNIDVPRDAALSTARRLTSGNPAQMGRLVQTLRIDDVPDHEVKDKKKKKSKKQKKKKNRAKGSSDTEASDSDCSSADDSMKYENLPPFVKPLIKDEGMPTIYDYLGAQDDSWELNTDKYKFLSLVQKMLDEVFPHKPYELKKKDIIYKWCRQQVYEWHRGFQRTANNVVRAEIETRRADVRLSKEDRSDAGILAWLEDAIAKGGAATWGRPDIIEPTRAKDQLQSKFVLKVVAYHLGMCVGSTRVPEADEHSDPVGALALAACAIERAFMWYSENQLKGLPQVTFSKKKAGKDTGKWRDTAVQELIDKPHRLDRLFSSAAALVAVPARSSVPTNTVNRLYVRERSSSPPTAPYDAYDEDT